MEPTSQEKPASRRRLSLILLLGIFALAGGVYTYQWFTVLRHQQETDDAYVGGNTVQIAPQIAGSVTAIAADDTDTVQAGAVLVRLDPADASLALEKARTLLAETVRQTRRLMTETAQLTAVVTQRRTDLARAHGDLARRESLVKADAVTKEDLQHAREAVQASEAALRNAEEQLKANKTLLLDTPLAQQPAVERAATQLREAWLTLQRTNIVSPVTGQVARRSVQVGTRVAPGTPLMAVVPLNHVWVDANFKEVQLRDMRIGQPAVITADMYGSTVHYTGKVAGFAAGTGSAFALLPPQNASGNWIKVVQRVPVRIELDPAQVAQHPLRVGLSMLVKVDTTNTSGPVMASAPRQNAAYATTALEVDMREADAMIRQIITANAR